MVSRRSNSKDAVSDRNSNFRESLFLEKEELGQTPRNSRNFLLAKFAKFSSSEIPSLNVCTFQKMLDLKVTSYFESFSAWSLSLLGSEKELRGLKTKDD